MAPLVQIEQVSAATANTVPDADVANGWTVLGGTDDLSCAGGTSCDFVDEGATAATADYVSTGTAGAGGEVLEYGLATVANVSSASQIVVYAHMQSATNANGGNLDTVGISLRIAGTLHTAVTVTPAFASWGWFSATFTGTWTQADIDGAQAYLIRNMVGGGAKAGQDDDVHVASIYADVTYTPSTNYEQAGYRWYGNQDTATPPTFIKAAGGFAADDAKSIVHTSDGGYAAVGQTASVGAGNFDMLFSKYDDGGNLTFSRAWGGGAEDVGASIIQTSDGGYAVTGRTASFGAGSNDLFLVKYDSAGALSFSRVWGGTGSDVGNEIIQTSDGGYAITGLTDSFGAGLNDMLLVKYDSAGTLGFSRTWGGTGSESGQSLIQNSDGGYAITGATTSFGAGLDDMFFAVYDSAGTLSFSRVWGGASTDFGYSLIQTSAAAYVIAGLTANFGAGGRDMILVKYDSLGALLSSRTWGGAGADAGHGIVKTGDGGYAVVGITASFGSGGNDIFLAKYDSTDTLGYSRTWGGTGNDIGNEIAQTADGGYAIGGKTASFGAGGDDGLLARYDSTGTIAGCGTACTSPTATTGSPTPTTSSPTATTSSPAPTTSSPFATTSSPTMTVTVIVATEPPVPTGATLAAGNTAAKALAEGTTFRLRLLLHVSLGALEANKANLKLQFAPRGTDNSCDLSFTGETYADVGTTGSSIRYADNTNAVDGQLIAATADDPAHGTDTVILQNYQENNNFTNTQAIAIGEDGMWDFALVDAGAPASKPYCFRVIKADNSLLTTYSVIPEITTADPTYEQSGFRAYENKPRSADSFIKTWGGTGSEHGESVVQTSDGGYAVVGESASFGAGVADAFLAKYDSAGTLSWSRTWGGAGADVGRSVVQTSDGGFALTGYTASFGAGGYDAFVAKYDSAGTLSWSRTWGGAGDDRAHAIVKAENGSFAITGYTASFGAGGQDMFFAKYDSTGTLDASRTWGGTVGDIGNSLVLTSDGGYAVVGTTSSFGSGGSDAFFAKYDSAGTLSFSRTWGGTGTEYGTAITQTGDGGYAITGTTGSYIAGTGLTNMYLAKYDSAGTLLFSRAWDGTNFNNGRSVIQSSDNGYVITGDRGQDENGVGGDMFLVKYDAAGTLLSSHIWGGSAFDGGQSLIQTADGGYAVAGKTASHGAGGNDMFLLKYDSAGKIVGCGAQCSSLSPSTSSPAVTAGLPAVTIASPTVSISSPTVSGTNPVATERVIAGPVTFAKLVGGTGDDFGSSVARTNDGGYAVIGETTSFGAGGSDLYVTKYNTIGTLSFSRAWGGTGNDVGNSVGATADGGFVVTGTTTSFGAGGNDMFLAKYNSSGSVNFSRAWGGTGNESGVSVVQTSDGGYAVTGRTTSFGAGLEDMFLAKYSSTGALEFSRIWGGTGSEQGSAVIQTSDGGYAITGKTTSTDGGGEDMFITRYDSAGTRMFSRSWGAAGNEMGASLIQLADNSFVITGSTTSYGTGNRDIYLAKFDSSGTLIFSRTLGVANSSSGNALTKTSDGGFAVTGSMAVYDAGDQDVVLAKYDSAGTLEFTRIWGNNDIDFAVRTDVGASIVEADDGGYLIAGNSTSFGAGANDFLMLKFDSSGDMASCGMLCSSPTMTASSPSAGNQNAVLTNNASAAVTVTTVAPTTSSPASSQTTIVEVKLTAFILPGTPLAASGSAAELATTRSRFRLRIGLHVTGKPAPSGQSFKLQAAPSDGTCNVSAGESYADVTAVSSGIAFYDNSWGVTNDKIKSSGDDPVHLGHANVMQSYTESNNFSSLSLIPVGQDGVWDFSLKVNGADVGRAYCFRIVSSTGTALASYSSVAEVFIPPSMDKVMRGGKYFNRQAFRQPFTW